MCIVLYLYRYRYLYCQGNSKEMENALHETQWDITESHHCHAVLLLYLTYQLITFTCCPSCKSIATPSPPPSSVTSTTLVTHPDGLSGKLRGIIRNQQRSGKRAARDLQQTPCHYSALCLAVLCYRSCHRRFCATWPPASPSSPHMEHCRSQSQGSRCFYCTKKPVVRTHS